MVVLSFFGFNIIFFKWDGGQLLHHFDVNFEKKPTTQSVLRQMPSFSNYKHLSYNFEKVVLPIKMIEHTA